MYQNLTCYISNALNVLKLTFKDSFGASPTDGQRRKVIPVA